MGHRITNIAGQLGILPGERHRLRLRSQGKTAGGEARDPIRIRSRQPGDRAGNGQRCAQGVGCGYWIVGQRDRPTRRQASPLKPVGTDGLH